MKWFLLTLLLVGCAPHTRYFFCDLIPVYNNNKSILDACEEYRLAVERKDVDALMLTAHKQYWDRGRPTGTEGYGYDGLRNVLLTRFQNTSEIGYAMRYEKVHQQCPVDLQPGCRAMVEVLVDASWSIVDAFGKPVRMDKRDQNQLELEWDGRRWLFLSGY